MAKLTEVHIGERSAWVHLPSDSSGDQKLPLVLVFHGGHTSGLAMVPQWKEYFDRGIILAFPNGQKTDPSYSGWYPVSGDVKEHIPFIHALVDDLTTRHPADKDRVFAAGFSDGGQMVMRLACHSDYFRGFAVVAASLFENTREGCAPKRQVPMMFVFGTSDAKTPAEGMGPGRQGSGRLGTEATIDFFLEKNGCNKASAVSRDLPDESSDGTSVRERLFTECTGAPLRAFTVEGGGHFWPSRGAPPTAGRCTDFSATDEAMALWLPAKGGPR